MTGGGLLLVAGGASAWFGPVVGPVPILAGAALVGLLIDNPGNEAVLAVGLLGPIIAGMLAKGEILATPAPLLAGSLFGGIALLFFGLMGGIIARRRWKVPVLPDQPAAILLGFTGLASCLAWILVPGLAFTGV